MANGYDLGATPPPPGEVVTQMAGRGEPGMGGMLGAATNELSMLGQAEMSARIQQAEPLLIDLARQVQALAPDVNNLLTRFRGKVAPQSQVPQELPPSPGAAPAPGVGSMLPPGGAAAATPPPVPATPGGAIPSPAVAPAGAQATPTREGLMGLVQQIELLLPQIAAADPTLSADIQFFIARLRDEVPKAVEAQNTGTTQNLTPPPTDEMLTKIPVVA